MQNKRSCSSIEEVLFGKADESIEDAWEVGSYNVCFSWVDASTGKLVEHDESQFDDIRCFSELKDLVETLVKENGGNPASTKILWYELNREAAGEAHRILIL